MNHHFPRHGRKPTRLTTVALLATCAAFGATMLAGCAGDTGSPDGSATPSVAGTSSAEGSVTASPPPGQPSSKPKPSIGGPSIPPLAKDEITLTGRVEKIDLEGGCLVLRVGSQSYELIGGDPVVLQHGNQVRVTGILRPDLATICQVGPVLDVVSSQPA